MGYDRIGFNFFLFFFPPLSGGGGRAKGNNFHCLVYRPSRTVYRKEDNSQVTVQQSRRVVLKKLFDTIMRDRTIHALTANPIASAWRTRDGHYMRCDTYTYEV